MKMEDDAVLSPEYTTDTDLSFTSLGSSATTFTSSSSSRSSLAALSSLSFNDRSFSSKDPSFSFSDHRAFSFNDRLNSTSSSTLISTPSHHRPHRRHDPHWSAIKTASPDGRLHLHHLNLLRRLGAGDLGRVFLCRLADAHFALKVVDLDALSSKKLAHAETEARILSSLDHPFLPTLYAHIQASHYSCLLIDYCPRGDLNSLLRRHPHHRLPLASVKFYASEVLVALEYLHSIGVVYRDLKPENILIREDGHIMLSDFDLSFTSEVTPRIDLRVEPTRKRRNKIGGCFGPTRGYVSTDEEVGVAEEFVAEPTTAYSKSCVGTHEYLAPELVCGNGHGNGVDWWAFGVLIYELLYGRTPFKGANKEATLRNIVSERDVEFPEGEGIGEVKDLIERLLVKDPRTRLGGSRGAADIKRHPFFQGVKWPLIRSYKPPEMEGGVGRKGSRSRVVGEVRRREWWWRGLSYVVKKSKGSLKSLKHTSSSVSYVSITKFDD